MIQNEKVKLVNDFKDILKNVSMVLFLNYQGTKVQEINEIRKKLKESSSNIKVLKNTLMERIFDSADKNFLSSLIVGPTAIAYTCDFPADFVKNLLEFQKNNKNFIIRGGYFYGRAITPEKLSIIQTLPSVEKIKSTFLTALNSPMQRFLTLIKSSANNFLSLLKERSKTIN